MGKRKKPAQLCKRVEAALNATGLPWTIDSGTKHFKLRLCGRVVGLVAQGVKGEKPKHFATKTIKQIEQTAAEIKKGK